VAARYADNLRRRWRNPAAPAAAGTSTATADDRPVRSVCYGPTGDRLGVHPRGLVAAGHSGACLRHAAAAGTTTTAAASAARRRLPHDSART
jgi:hypothetical protein